MLDLTATSRRAVVSAGNYRSTNGCALVCGLGGKDGVLGGNAPGASVRVCLVCVFARASALEDGV